MTSTPRKSLPYIDPCEVCGGSHLTWLHGPPRATCPSTTPEPHLLGEFPMTCYRCHTEADS